MIFLGGVVKKYTSYLGFNSTTLWDIDMRHEEIYNNVRVVLGTFLLFGMFMIVVKTTE